jgi:hypothetical protein
MHFETWLEKARSLSKSHKSVNWEIGDHITLGKRIFGDDAITAVRKTTRWTAGYVRRVAAISERFPTEKRLPEVSWYVYQRLQPFPPEITDRLIPLAAEKNVGARRLYAMAVEMAGEDPAERTKNRTKKVALPIALFAKLRERANGGKVSKLAQQAIEEWLVGKPVERTPSGTRTLEWKEQVLASKKAPEPIREAELVPEPAKPKQEAVAPTLTVPAADGEDKSPRPTYSERRKEQLAAGAEPIASKKRCTCKIKVLWTECRPKEFIQDSEGRTIRFREAIKPTSFKTEEDATNANEVYAACHGYTEQVVFCAPCGAWHLKHIYSVEWAGRGVPIGTPERRKLRVAAC